MAVSINSPIDLFENGPKLIACVGSILFMVFISPDTLPYDDDGSLKF